LTQLLALGIARNGVGTHDSLALLLLILENGQDIGALILRETEGLLQSGEFFLRRRRSLVLTDAG